MGLWGYESRARMPSYTDMETTGRPRVGEAKLQAKLAAEAAPLQMEHGRCFVVEQPVEPTMWETRAMGQAATDASTIIVSVESAEGGGQVRVAANSTQVA